jgi:hypothetical protein
MLAEKSGETAAALKEYDMLAAQRDRSVGVRAAVRAMELRLATHAIDAAGAADVLDRLLIAWRGDEREFATRLRLAELRAKAGRPRAAIGTLRETLGLWPERAEEIRPRLAAIIAGLLPRDGAAGIPPLEFAALIEENADLLPSGVAGQTLTLQLADRLMALDLPRRAAGVLEGRLPELLPGDARAELGARLAEARLAAGDAAGTITALADTAGEGIAADLAGKRTILLARAIAAKGDVARAIAALDVLGSPAADLTRATILEQAHDWPDAVTTLSAIVAHTMPSTGPLSEDQRGLLLRLAEAAAQAGDSATLRDLGQRNGDRMAGGAIGSTFRLLTAHPVDTIDDLRRAREEIAIARTLPAELAKNAMTASSRP